MSISAVESATTTETLSLTDSNESMGQTEFLELLIAQLQNQDPLNPADSTEFTSQLAQFSSLEQMTNMNSALDSIRDTLGGNTNTQVVSYIGKTVVATGSAVEVGSDGVDPILVSLDSDAESLYVNIYNGSGNFVRQIEAGSAEAGNHSITWDGTDSSGSSVSQGWYSFEIQAVDSSGDDIDAETYVSGKVLSVAYEDGSAYLNVDGRRIALADVIEVGGTGDSE
jgi:flagellar basal-body rod modification protein FlgD